MNRPKGLLSATNTDRGSYFFISYAHQSPPVRSAEYTSDPWVRKLFRDLNAAVSRLGTMTTIIRPGFIDQELRPGSDWNAELAEALSAAEVFVPLYSPGYFTNSWSLRERAAFQQRLRRAGAPASTPHVIPVLWAPFPPWEEHPDVPAAYALGEDMAVYRENGLRAMCMLAYYHEQYSVLVERLAARIVTAAEQAPLVPSPAPPPNEVAAPDTEPAFVSAVLVPREGRSRELRHGSVYGASGADWRPFADRQDLPAAAYVASIAERLGLPVVTGDLNDVSDLLGRYPAVLLVDAWVLAEPDGDRVLFDAAKSLAPWVVPLVVTDDDALDADRASQLAGAAVDALNRAGATKAEQVGSLEELVETIAGLVTEARRQFLKHGPISAPAGDPGKRWRLSDADG